MLTLFCRRRSSEPEPSADRSANRLSARAQPRGCHPRARESPLGRRATLPGGQENCHRRTTAHLVLRIRARGTRSVYPLSRSYGEILVKVK